MRTKHKEPPKNPGMANPKEPIKGSILELAGLKTAQAKALADLHSHPDEKESTYFAGKVADMQGCVYEIGVVARRTKENTLEIG